MTYRTFRLSCQVTVSAYTSVRSDSLEDAIKKAADRPVFIGGPRTGANPFEEWIIDDADGDPDCIRGEDQ